MWCLLDQNTTLLQLSRMLLAVNWFLIILYYFVFKVRNRAVGEFSVLSDSLPLLQYYNRFTVVLGCLYGVSFVYMVCGKSGGGGYWEMGNRFQDRTPL